MTRISLISIVALLFSLRATAQDFKITVIDESRSVVPYAYIYINSLGVAVTDLEGVGFVPCNKLAVNDTLKVLFLGMKTQKVILDRSILADENYTFVMKEEPFNIDEVVVKGDAEKYFHKCTNLTSAMNYNCEMSAEFDTEVHFPDGHTERASGAFTSRNEIWSKQFERPFLYGWFHHPPQYTTEDDISSIKDILDISLRVALDITYREIRKAKHTPIEGWRANYSYLGVDGNNKIFRLAYEQLKGQPTQCIFYIDNQTKDLTRIEIQCFDDERKITTYIEGNNAKYAHQKPKRNPVLLPIDLTLTTTLASSKQIKLKISNVKIHI